MAFNNSDYIISSIALTKLYGRLRAVDQVSLSVKKGEIYGFLGLNGAGKTTTIRILLGMIKADSGETFVLGEKICSGKGPWEKVGYLVEMPYSYPELTVKENLLVVGRLRGSSGSNADEIIKMLQLKDQEDLESYFLRIIGEKND